MTILYFSASAIAGASFWPASGRWGNTVVGRALARVAPAFGLGGGTPASPTPAPLVTATKTAQLLDGDADSKADPGETIRYTVTVSDATSDATGVHVVDTPDANTTFVPGSIVLSPLAIDESYASVGNMTLTSASIGANCGANPLRSVTCNDTLNGGTLTGFGDAQANAAAIVVNGSNTVTTTNGGTVLLNTDGTFVYNPAAGFEGADSFWYTLTSPGGIAGTDNAQVTINVGGANGMVWFVTPAGAGTGRQASPISLNNFRPLNVGTGSNPAAGDTIFLFEGAHPLTATLTLLGTQKLIGQDTTATLASLGAPTPQAGNAYPAVNNPTGTAVSITSSVAALTLGSGNVLAGFTVGNSTAAITGGVVGTLGVRDVIVNTNGTGVSITTSGTLSNTGPFTGFTSVTSTGGGNGVSLAGVDGTANLGGGDLNGNGGVAFNVSGGNATINYSGTIRNSGGRQVSIVNKTGGTVTFSGAVSGTGTGIFLDNNDQSPGVATIAFTGGVALSTGSANAFTATNGGIVTATQNNTSIVNTLATTTGTALNIASTTIGANDVTFRSISSNGAANGIVLNTTGSAGSLIVSGNGAACTSAVTCTGGAIQNATVGVSLTSTTGVSIDRLFIQNTTGSGIQGTTVTDFTFTNGRIDNSGTSLGAEMSNIAFNSVSSGVNNIAGVVTITGTVLTNAYHHGIDIYDEAGTISNLVITGNSLTSSTSTVSSKGVGIRVQANGSAAGAAAVTVGTVSSNGVHNFPSDSGIKILGGNAGGSTQAVLGDPASPTNLVTISANDIDGASSASPMGSNGIEVAMTGNGKANVAIVNNGSVADPIQHFKGIGIAASGGNNAVDRFVIDHNFVDGGDNIFGSRGMAVGTQLGVGQSGTVSASVTNNVVNNSDGNGIFAGALNSGNTGNFIIKNNTVGAPRGTGTSAISVQVGSATGNVSVCLDMASNTATGSNDPTFGPAPGIKIRKQNATQTPNQFGIVGLSPSPTDAAHAEDVLSAANPGSSLGDPNWSVTGRSVRVAESSGVANNYVSCGAFTVFASPRELPTTLAGAPHAIAGNELTATGVPVAASVRRVPTVMAAAYRTAANLVDAGVISRVRTWKASGANHLAAVARNVRMAHISWPSASGIRSRLSDVLASARLTIADALMAPLRASPPPPPVDVDVAATLPVGKTVRVVFDVTVNTPPVAQYSNSATVSGSNFGDVTTNTATTTGDRYNTTTALLSSLNPSFQGDSITFTATVTPAEGSGLTPNGTVQFKDGGVNLGSAVICADAGGQTCSAQFTTTTLATGSRSITADYLGGTNHDPSTSNTVVQVNNACTINPIVQNNADAGAGSLRQAILDACGSPGNNTITFDMGSVVSPIGLTSGALVLTRNVTLNGPGANVLTVQRTSGTARVFQLSSGKTATISGLTISGGNAATGAGILNDHGTLTITNSTISGNGTSSTAGGGILNDGDTTAASLTIVNSTLSGNTSANGGAVYNQATSSGTATATITNTTISGNTATGGGGGIRNFGSTPTGAVVTLTNSTITNNHADQDNSGAETGGGVSLITSNTVTLRNTIVARNYTGSATTTADDIAGTIDSGSASNLIGVDTNLTGVTNGANGNQVGTGGIPIDPRLGPLGDNGGRTLTHALLTGSPALDAGDNTFVVTPPFLNASPITDQRGTAFNRIRDAADADTTARVDIGALEADPTVEDITDKLTNEDTPLPIVFNVGDGTTAFGTLTATSSDTTVVPNVAANLAFTGSGSTRTLTITPALNASGTTTITVTVPKTIGGTLLTATDTFVLTVNPANDPPSGGDGIVFMLEDHSYTLAVADFHFTDPVEGNAFQAVKVSLPAKGSLTNNGGAVASGDFISAADIGAGALVFTPAPNDNGSPDYTSLSFQVQDDGGTANGGVDLDPSPNLLHFFVSPVNDPPAGTDNTVTMNEGATHTFFPFDFGFTDPIDHPGHGFIFVKITTLPSAGTLRKSGVPVTAGQFVSASNLASGQLVFTPAADANGSGYASFTFQVQDNGGTFNGGIDLDQTPNTMTIDVTPINDPPSFTKGPDQTISQGAGPQTVPGWATNLSAGPPDEGGQALSFNVTVTGTTGTLAFTTPPAVDSSGTLTFTHNTATFGTANVSVTLSDSGSNTPPNSNTSAAQTFTITVTPCSVNPIVSDPVDGNPNSLRQAIVDACPNATITFGITGSINVQDAGSLVLARNVTINGPGAGNLNIRRVSPSNLDYAVFAVNSGVTATIRGVTISLGRQDGGHGGGISNEGTLTVEDTVLALNRALQGGGIVNLNGGSLTVRQSTLTGNTALDSGGGIYSEGTVTLLNSTVSGNLSRGDGGGITQSGAGAMTITSSTISDNRSDSDNSVTGTGGGLFTAVSGSAPILRNSIVAGNFTLSAGSTRDDVSGALSSSSASSLIGDGTGMTGVTHGTNGNQVGTGASPIDPKLGPLTNNGGSTPTHALLAGSLAIEAGDNALVVGTTDQRGIAFGRIKDSADADAIATVDIGAFEVDPAVEDILDKSTSEDTPLPVLFNLGDASTPFDGVTATSSNTTLVPNTPANLSFTGGGSTRTLTITPALDQSGTTTITVTVTKTIGGTLLTATDTFVLTVNAVNDPPTLNPIPDPAAVPEDSALQTVNLSGISAGGGESQPLTVTATSSNHALIPDPAVTYSSPGATGSLTYTPVAGASGTAVITVTVNDNGGGTQTVVRTFTVAVNPVADTPSVTGTTTNEDTQTTNGLVISRNGADGAEVTHFKITGITNGTLFQNDGATPINNNDFVTFAQANAGLKFTPAPNFFGSGSFTVQASVSGLDAGLGGSTATATITVNAVADTPSVTNATTVANVQTTTGLVISRNAADSTEVGFFKITGITNGTLFKANGTTPIANNDFITFAEANAGLKFTPTPGGTATGSFGVQASLSAGDGGLGGGIATATITVNPHPTTTTVVSDDPDPSDRFVPVTVVYTVVSADSGPTPTGTVTVTISGGPETCTGTVAGGQCVLTPTVAGVDRVITVSYGGDAVNAISTSTTLHTVRNCPTTAIVTTTADSGAGSLRQAIADACTTDSITFDIPGPGPDTIDLTTGELVLDKNLTITGPTSKALAISGTHTSRVFNVAPGATVALSNMTIADGQGAFGGGIYTLGDLTIRNSTITGNQAVGGEGGGIDAEGGTLTILDSTISGNTADINGGGLLNRGTTTAVLVNVTITNNQADANADLSGVGGGIGHVSSSTLTLRNTIVAGNRSTGSQDDDINNETTGSVIDPASHHNLIGVDTGLTGITASNGNLIGNSDVPLDPRLGPLQFNGGPTATHALRPGSPALDAGDNPAAAAAGLTTDQRGLARVRDAADLDTTATVDMGAVEADPIIEDILDQFTPEQTPRSFVFRLGDATIPFDSVTATSDNPTLVPNANISVTGSGSTRTLTLTPLVDQEGTSTITVTATKTIGGVPQTSVDTFVLTVTGVNDAPTLNAIPDPPAILEDAALQTINLSGITAGGGETQVLTVTASSSNRALIPDPTVSYTSPNGTASLSYTPVANANGSAIITVTVRDDGDGTNTFKQTFTVNVTPVNDAPTLNLIADPAAILEDAPLQTVNLGGISAGPGESQTLTVTATSNNTALIPNPTVSYTSPNAIGSLSYTPVANANGTAVITVTVDDGGSAPSTVVRMFSVTVTPVNDNPTIAAIADQQTPANTPLGVPLTIGDLETAAASLTVTATSSNQTLVPNANLVVGSGGTSRTLTLTPAANQSGTATITVTVNDGTGGSASRMFVVTVLPGLSIGDATIVEGNGGTTNLSVTVTLAGPSASAVSAHYATRQRTAIDGVDYLGVAGTVSFAPGATTATILVPVVGDTATEIDETFWIELSAALGGTITDAQAVATIANDDPTSPVSAEVVAWTRRIGVTADGGSLTKTAPAGWNAAASATKVITTGDGSVEFSATATTQTWVVGLSRSTTPMLAVTDIGFGLQLFADGTFAVVEHGVNLTGPLGSYATGDRFAIAVTGGVVTYRRNGVTVYTSAGTPVYPLRVDAGLFTAGGTISEVVLAGRLARLSSTTGDVDNDGKSDMTVFRASTGGWHTLKSNAGYTTSQSVSWGLPTDVPAPGDYDGDGKMDPAIFRPSTGLWAILKSSTNYTTSTTVSWGLSTDVPVPADYDGDGKTDPAVYRPSTGGWYILKSSTNYTSSIGVLWGLSTDVPLPADYDGDGQADPAIYRPSTGLWAILKSSTGYGSSTTVSWGLSTDIAVPGDYDGDGKADPAVYRPSTGTWHLLQSTTSYATSASVAWGLSSDVPVPADYDGDGRYDPAIFRPSTGQWAILKSTANYSSSLVVSWGLSTDTPINRRP